MKVWASWSAVIDSATARATGWISSLARGPTTTPPTTMPVPGRQKSLTKPSRTPCILARGLPPSGSITTSAWISPASTACCDQPTVAISGAVKTLEETFLRSSGCTVSPRKCHIAIRPCIAATEASISTPVQSPAAYTPRAEVRETRSTLTKPPSLSTTPDSSRPRSAVLGTEPSARMQCEPCTVRPSVRVTVTTSPSRVTDSIRDFESTFMPRRSETSCSTSEASASSPGSTRSREETRVTGTPRAR